MTVLRNRLSITLLRRLCVPLLWLLLRRILLLRIPTSRGIWTRSRGSI